MPTYEFTNYLMPTKVVLQPDPRQTPFYIEDVSGSDSTLTVNTYRTDVQYVQYSTDGVNWGDEKPTIPANGRVYMRAKSNFWNSGSDIQPRIESNNNFNVGGNIMSLLYGSEFTGNEISFPTPTSRVFYSFFGSLGNAVKVVNAGNLILPATTLNQECYYSMFFRCTGLTTAPDLPATTMERECYYGMFHGCTGLTTAPDLPATTLAAGCYSTMFYGCTGLTTAPDLPAVNVGDSSYVRMFYNCSSLNSIKCFGESFVNTSLNYWVSGVSATGTFYKSTNATWPTGESGIPSGWTVVNI